MGKLSVIVLFTDFGLDGPYTGQMKAVLAQMAPGIAVIDLFADAPVGNPKASAYLLAAYASWFPAKTVFLCVVDPGVGGTRPAIIIEAHGSCTLVPATACSSSCSGAQETRKALTLTGSPRISRRASTGAICSRPSRPCWREGSHCQADLARIMTTVVQIGPTILRKSSMSIISATP